MARAEQLEQIRMAIEQPPALTRAQMLQLASTLARPPITQSDLFGRPTPPTAHPGMHHTCHWPGCTTPVRPALWGCKYHWFLLPLDLRNDILRTYRPGQEITKRPSSEYIAAARRVQDWISKQGR